jgi:hypothetical protein
MDHNEGFVDKRKGRSLGSEKLAEHKFAKLMGQK